MIENEVIINKLATEGIDAGLAIGVQFETEEALNTWVGTAKTFMEKPKALNEYTLDELRQGADKGEFKNVQSLLDKIRSEAKTPKTVTVPEPPTPNADIEAFKAQFEEIKNAGIAQQESLKKAALDAYVSSKTAGFDPLEVAMLKASLPATATEADIDKAVSDYKALMVKRGLRSYATDSASAKSETDDASLDASIERLKAAKQKK